VVDLVLHDAGEKPLVAPVDLVAVDVDGLHLDLRGTGHLHADVRAGQAALVHHLLVAARLRDAGVDEDLPVVLAADALLVEILHLEGDDALADPDLRGGQPQGVVALQEGLDEGPDVLFRLGVEGDGQVGGLPSQERRLLLDHLPVAPELPGLVCGHMRPLPFDGGIVGSRPRAHAVPFRPGTAQSAGRGLEAQVRGGEQRGSDEFVDAITPHDRNFNRCGFCLSPCAPGLSPRAFPVDNLGDVC